MENPAAVLHAKDDIRIVSKLTVHRVGYFVLSLVWNRAAHKLHLCDHQCTVVRLLSFICKQM